MQQLAATRFPVLRSVLHEGFDRFDDDQFEHQLGYYWPDTSAEELEINFGKIGRSLSRGFGKVGGVLSKAAPGALSGAVQGAQMGAALGPYGMLAGAALGAVGGGYMSYRGSQQPPPSQPQARPQAGGRPAPIPQPVRVPTTPPTAQPVPQRAAVPPVPGTPGRATSPPLLPQQPGSAPAINRGQALLQMLGRPEVINALLSLAAGQLGRQQIQVGSRTASPSQVVALAGMTPPAGLPVNAEDEAWFDPYEQESLLHEMEQYAAETHPFFEAIERAPDPYAPPDYFDDGAEPEYFPETFDDWPEEEFVT